jgi:hypothetical protein
MASTLIRGKALPCVYLDPRLWRRAGQFFTGTGGMRMVAGIAIAMFVALVGWGGRYFGWSDPDSKVQLALVTSFILGIIGGFKSRG